LNDFFHKLFNRTKSLISEQSTSPLPQNSVLTEPKVSDIHLEPPQFSVACSQSVGKQREHNEDALFTLTTSLASDTTHLPFGLYLVADGMGGHLYGEKASGIAVRCMASYILRKLYLYLLSPKPVSLTASIQEIMRDGVQDTHRAIIKDAPGGGTTLTALLILGEQMTIAHIGDTRAYIVSKDGKIQSLTRDHSLVNRLVELGQITLEEAAVHPQRNVLYLALGQSEMVEPEISTIPVPKSGYLFLCSDGLWGVVPEKEISELICNSANPQIACQELINAANAAGGPDNITAILIRVPD
jgi:PPM family protein phosphatase